MKEKVDKKLVSFRLPEDLMQDLRERADADNISMTELVCRLLRQGLQTVGVDGRVATLEAEIRELKQSKSVNFNPVAPTTVYALPSFVTPESDLEIKRRMDQLESMMQEVLTNTRRSMKPPQGEPYYESEE